MCIYKVLIPFDGIITVTYNHRYKSITYIILDWEDLYTFFLID